MLVQAGRFKSTGRQSLIYSLLFKDTLLKEGGGALLFDFFVSFFIFFSNGSLYPYIIFPKRIILIGKGWNINNFHILKFSPIL
jgi:hypothetical protein